MSNKILVGCPTHQSKQFCWPWFARFFKEAVNNQECDVLFVDNSPQAEHRQAIQRSGYEVIHNSMQFSSRIESIVSSRNMLINRCIDGGYEALLFVDTDLLIPKETIPTLLATDKDIIGGIYLGGQQVGDEVKLCPVLFKKSQKGEEFVELAGANEVMDERVMEVAAIGFGCCMIKRKVLERVPLRYDKERDCAEDIYFAKDARDHLNIETYAHTGVKCIHLVEHAGKVIPYEFRKDL